MQSIIKEIAYSYRSRAVAAMFAALNFALGLAGAAQAAEPAAPSLHAVEPSVAPRPTLRPDAPDLYTVQPGDTLWGIAQRFLADPWRWPELWEGNRDQIANPHRIYPGQTLVLDRAARRLRVATPLYEKRFPAVRGEPLRTAIPTLPLAAIHPFLTRPLVVTRDQIETAGRIVAFAEGRTMGGAFDHAYAVGVPLDVTRVYLFRPLQPITARDGQTVLGYEARYLGEAEVTPSEQPEQGAFLTITKSVAEIRPGDRLIAPEAEPLANFTPHAPEADFSARILTFWNPQPEAGPFEVVLLDAGEAAGLERGHVVALWREPAAVTDPETNAPVLLPPHRYGLAMVFRTFPNLAYALVLEATDSVRRGDRVLAPGVPFQR